MPTDKVQNKTFKQMFGSPVRFSVPFFQRGYAWEKKQWDQLFLDLQEQVIDELASGSPLGQIEHFFGPIVVMEQTGTAGIRDFLVVDGQQRITTVYLLLGIIREQLRLKSDPSGGLHGHLAELESYLVNEAGPTDDYSRLKVLTAKGDRLPTFRVVFGADADPPAPSPADSLHLHAPGHSGVDDFRRYADRKLKTHYAEAPALWQLAQALLNCLPIVWIPLDREKDDEQAIFESLNDKGMPLSAGELLCSYLFRPIARAGGEVEDLHDQMWLGAIRLLDDHDRFEDYLRNLFSIGEARALGNPRKVYVHFKRKNRHLGADEARQHLKDIHAGAAQYRAITNPLTHPHRDPVIAQLLGAISHAGIESSTPFVLSVLLAHAAGTLADDLARAVLRNTLALLVRRKMTELPTSQYEAMFPQLFGRIANEPDLIRALHDQFKKHSVWVSDQEFDEALRTRPAYRSRDLAFSRMVLVEIDKAFQAQDHLPDYSTVSTIEHMIPQVLTPEWRLYLGQDADDEYLPTVIQTIGNLCLLSRPANSAANRDPFESKKAAYSATTALARLLKTQETHWDIAAVRRHSQLLAAKALGIWAWGAGTPRPA